MSDPKSYAPGTHPDLPAPVAEVGVVGWVRHNLFSTWYNILLTALAFWVVYLLVPPLIHWTILDADWVGTTRQDCSRQGACWVYIHVWFRQLMYGLYQIGRAHV